MGITSYPRTARLVNRFKVGADPEFIFVTLEGAYQYAENLGLNTREAFGCDMAGRQAEIRATPSRFALEVVASIMDSLRWMAEAVPVTQAYTWSATAYNGKDGCGGHVHFGRRLPGRDHDLDIMDSVCRSLVDSGVFNTKHFLDRRRNTHYGHYGDFRIQPHGFEYRTLPTSMSSPWLCYFVLVISKLAVYEGIPFPAKMTHTDFTAYVIDLLQKYQDMDDDAAIALRAVRLRGFPMDTEDDFKFRWGVRTVPLSLRKADFDVNTTFFPSMIEPEEQTCQELFDWLVRGLTMPIRKPVKPTWEPFALPKEFSKVRVQPHTRGHLPDVGMNLVSRNIPVTLILTDTLYISTGIKLPVSEIQKALNVKSIRASIHENKASEIQIGVPKGINEEGVLCKFLHSVIGNPELFPVCKAQKLHTVDWSRWEPLVLNAKKPLIGNILHRVVGTAAPAASTEKQQNKPGLNIHVGAEQAAKQMAFFAAQPLGQEYDPLRVRVADVIVPAPNPRPRKRRLPEDF